VATDQLSGYWSSSWRGGGVSFPLREESFVTALKGCPLKPETLSARLVPGSRIGSVGQVLIEAGFFSQLGFGDHHIDYYRRLGCRVGFERTKHGWQPGKPFPEKEVRVVTVPSHILKTADSSLHPFDGMIVEAVAAPLGFDGQGWPEAVSWQVTVSVLSEGNIFYECLGEIWRESAQKKVMAFFDWNGGLAEYDCARRIFSAALPFVVPMKVDENYPITAAEIDYFGGTRVIKSGQYPVWGAVPFFCRYKKTTLPTPSTT